MKIASQAYRTSGRLLYPLLWAFFALYTSTRTRGLVFDEKGKVLLVKNWIGNGKWDVPGGGLHHAESLQECLSREVYEETGLIIGPDNWKFLAAHRQHLTDFTYFTAVVQFKEPKRQRWEITDASWFDRKALPEKHHVLIDKMLSTYDKQSD